MSVVVLVARLGTGAIGWRWGILTSDEVSNHGFRVPGN